MFLFFVLLVGNSLGVGLGVLYLASALVPRVVVQHVEEVGQRKDFFFLKISDVILI